MQVVVNMVKQMINFSHNKYLNFLFKALKHHQKELEISIWMGDKDSECSTHGNLAVAYQALHQNNLAIKHYWYVI